MQQFMKVPCCFYPTKILVIDDRPEFTKWMSFKFKSYGMCEVYNDGLSAFDVLKNYQPQNFLSRVSTKEEFDFLANPEHKKIMVELKKIREEAGEVSHESEISVAIIDYDMPQMNGIELCRLIKHLPIKKIMLTAEADHKLAVEAFNEGLIDRFILKNTENVIQKIEETVFELQVAYFYDLSKAIIENPQEHEGRGQITCLTDPQFAAYFFQIFKNHQITEYYLLNHFGDFLMIDEQGQSYELGVRDLQAIGGLHNLATDLARQEPEDTEQILNEVLSKKKVPFFPENFDEYNSLTEWPAYFREVEEIKGAKGTYYCSFFALD